MGAFVALLYAYSDIVGLRRDDDSRCVRIVESSLDSSPSIAQIGLYSGWAGLGWLTTHLDADDDFVGVHVDRLLAGALASWSPRRGYDLISGLVGVGVHFLQRLPREAAARGLELVLEELERTAVAVNGGTTWLTVPEFLPVWQRERAPNGYFNLGVAHGVPGVCWLLAKMCTVDLHADRAETLLRGSLRWLRSAQPDPTVPELPAWIAPGVARVENRRMAWCYGPLGASAVTLEAAKAIGDREGVSWAQTLALACADVPPEQARVLDAALCHGAAGNAQIFYRLHRGTGERRFRDAASAWLRATLEYRQPGQGIGGYRMWQDVRQNKQDWVNDGSFLSGSAGVALALLTAATSIEPSWDRLLLLS
ncbi:MAG: lanthionine synthetase C family protein [Gemmatimonadota bacterium]|nr:lanthionine synthetase C family protein [Gemmatimonadota bacterium]